MAHHWPKELLILHCTVLSLGLWRSNYDYIVTNSINSLLIGSMVHILNIFEPILAQASKPFKNFGTHKLVAEMFLAV